MSKKSNGINATKQTDTFSKNNKKFLLCTTIFIILGVIISTCINIFKNNVYTCGKEVKCLGVGNYLADRSQIGIPLVFYKINANKSIIKILSKNEAGTPVTGMVKGCVDPKCSLSWEGEFKLGFPDGKMKFYAGKSLATEGSFKNGLRDGIWKAYNTENKKILATKTYKNGEYNGIQKLYDENGICVGTIHYENGEKKWEKKECND